MRGPSCPSLTSQGQWYEGEKEKVRRCRVMGGGVDAALSEAASTGRTVGPQAIRGAVVGAVREGGHRRWKSGGRPATQRCRARRGIAPLPLTRFPPLWSGGKERGAASPTSGAPPPGTSTPPSPLLSDSVEAARARSCRAAFPDRRPAGTRLRRLKQVVRSTRLYTAGDDTLRTGAIPLRTYTKGWVRGYAPSGMTEALSLPYEASGDLS